MKRARLEARNRRRKKPEEVEPTTKEEKKLEPTKLDIKVRETVKDVFSKLDPDGDGYISYQQWYTSLVNKPKLAEPGYLRLVYKLFDPDNSGSASLNAVLNAICQGSSLSDNDMQAIYFQAGGKGKKVAGGADQILSQKQFYDLIGKLLAPSQTKAETHDPSALSKMFDEPDEDTTVSSEHDDQQEDKSYENELLAAWNKAQEKEKNAKVAKERKLALAKDDLRRTLNKSVGSMLKEKDDQIKILR